jgi:hypothetical protein
MPPELIELPLEEKCVRVRAPLVKLEASWRFAVNRLGLGATEQGEESS